jgi:sRNA-binding carbon storage regulator CsrA
VLTLKLKAGESLQIGDDIRLVVRGDTIRGRVTIGIDAPRELNIARLDAPPAQEDKHKM